MKDPYEVLGVSRSASDAEIKSAYRNLAKKYHPDHFAGDENARELAEEKMKELNEAYDTIMNQRRSGNASSAGSPSGFQEIRDLITANRLEEALSRLDNISIDQRNAEWYFLTGSVQYKRGWFENAYTNFATACRMDPANPEYREALNRIQYSRGGYNPYRTGGNSGSGCSTCDLCAGMVCCDTCCECMGGDLIGCC